MDIPVTLEELKAHLNIDSAFKTDDALLMDYAAAAWAAILGDLDMLQDDGEHACPWTGDDGQAVPRPVIHAVKMLTGHLYSSREPVVYGVTPVKVPLSIEYLIAPYRNYKTR